MPAERAFPVLVAGTPPADTSVTMADLAFIPVPLDHSGRPLGGAAAAYRKRQHLILGVVFLALGSLVLIACLISLYGRASVNFRYARVIPVSLAVICLGAFFAWLGLRKSLDADPTRCGLAVPARMSRVIAWGIAGPVQTEFMFELYGNRHQIILPVRRALARTLNTSDPVSIIVVPRGPELVCFFDPEAAIDAINVALIAARAAPLPVARIATDIPELGPFAAQHFTLSFELTPEENDEALALTAHPRQATRAVAGPHPHDASAGGEYHIFIFVAVIIAIMMAFADRQTPPPMVSESAWPSAAALLLATAGTGLWLWGLHRATHNSITRGKLAYDLSEDSIRVQGPHLSAILDWHYFDRTLETPTLFLLARKRYYQALPQRALADDHQRLALRQFLHHKLPAVLPPKPLADHGGPA